MLVLLAAAATIFGVPWRSTTQLQDARRCGGSCFVGLGWRLHADNTRVTIIRNDGVSPLSSGPKP